MRLTLCGLMLALASTASAADHKYLKAFPPPAPGMTRYVILLPEKARGVDNNFRVELVVGRTLLTDGVNRMRIGGTIDAKPVKGWGFTMYEVKKLGPTASTLIGAPPGKPKVKRFVGGPTKMIRYNSRIPLVIYVPKGAEVQYRIWQATPKTQPAKQG